MMEHPLRLYRREHGLTLEQLASDVSVSSVSISRIETRQQRASYDLLRRLADRTGISVDELVRAATEEAA